jgi:tetratricopeptide (TPR) repeat protein
VNNDMSGEVSGGLVQALRIDGGVKIINHAPLPSVDIPRQLPPRRQFVNRETERDFLQRVVLGELDVPRLVVVTGVGGVGKTALAAEVAHAVSDHFPDGQLHADLGAFSPTGSASSTDLLAEFLFAMGLPAQHVPSTMAGRLASYRSRTAGRRLLVMLDDAATAGQVRPLIPASPHSAILITSRTRLGELAIDGARHVSLQGLQHEHAIGLLDAVLGVPVVAAERTAAEQIVGLCHRLPLALMVAAGLVATRSSRSLTSIAADLAARNSVISLSLGEISIRGVIDVSYDELSPRAGAIYHAMALHPGRFSAEVVAAAFRRTVADVQPPLEELVEANLLQDDATGRYMFHDLVREHAVEQSASAMSDRQRATVLFAIAHYYRDRSMAADIAIRPTQHKVASGYNDVSFRFSDSNEAMEWFRRDRDAVLGTLRVAVTREWDSDIAWSLAEPLWTLLQHDGHYGLVLETQNLGAQDAHRRAHHFEAVALARKAHALRHLGRYDEAKSWCTLALDLVETHVGQWSASACEWIESVAVQGRGHAAEGTGDLTAALVDYQRSLQIEQRRAVANPGSTGYGVALRLRDIAWVHARRGDAALAHQRLDEAEAIMRTMAETTGDGSGLGRTLYMRGRIHALAGHHEEAGMRTPRPKRS